MIAAGGCILPALALYSLGSTTAAIAAGVVGAVAAVPLILWPPQGGRRGYARLVAWATWLWEPRRCDPPSVDRDQTLPPIYTMEVISDGSRGRRRLLPDPPTAPR